MKQKIMQEKYPVFVLEMMKDETDLTTVKEIIDQLKANIEADPNARFIATFDHYGHTSSLEVGEIAEGILDAWNIVFCFGIAIPNPEVLAVRPRSIGVVEMTDRFVVSFLEAPMPVANTTMEKWVRALRRQPVSA